MEDNIKKEKIKVEVFQVYAKCECGGNMMFNGSVLTSYPAKYSHTCDKCGATKTLWEKYPHAEYCCVEAPVNFTFGAGVEYAECSNCNHLLGTKKGGPVPYDSIPERCPNCNVLLKR